MVCRSPLYHRSIASRVVLGFAALLTVRCFASPVSAQSGVSVYMRDTAGYPGQHIPIPVYLSNFSDVDTISGVQFQYSMSRSNVASYTLRGSGADTTFIGLDPPACTAFGTVISTLSNLDLDTVGSLLSGWELLFVSANSNDGYDFRPTGMTDTDFDNLPVGILPQTLDQRLFTDSVDLRCPPHPFYGDAVVIMGSEVVRLFSNTAGALIEPVTLGDVTISVLQPDPGDFDLSHFVDAVDVSIYIEMLFVGGSPHCSVTQWDLDCDGAPNSSDLSVLVDFAFFGGGPLPVCP